MTESNHLRQKRARSQLSCTACRSGKLKCDRNRDPACDQCIKRSRESSCVYLPPPVKQKPAQNVKGRIRALEGLVVDLMKQQNAQGAGQKETPSQSGQDSAGPFSEPTPPSDSDSSYLAPRESARLEENIDGVDNATEPFGQMRISKNEISYVGMNHWQAVLNGISDLRRELGDDDELDDGEAAQPYEEGGGFANVSMDALPSGTLGGSPSVSSGLGFMLGNSTAVTRQSLIAAVPEKKVADRLLSAWFNSPDPFRPILHAPAFQEEYRLFWKDPEATPTMWLGLLFAIISLSASFGLRDKDCASPEARKILDDVNKYHTLSASAAVLADFSKPGKHTIECLILYSAGLRSNDSFVNVWLSIGLVIRLALRMGYHRDPSSYPRIPAFDGEMRRRVWAIISMIDVLISFQLGLPSMVKTIQSDTQPPRNLLDRDFNQSTKTLPPSRGIDELTPSSYTRAKLQIVRIFADASDLSHATIQPAYEEMLELDRKLEEAKAQIPPLLQMPDISELVTDPAEQLMCRFNLDLLYLKTKTVLHRRYMDKPFSQLSPDEQEMGIGLDRKICVDCALRVLQHHHTIYAASQPGGQLESVKWYMGSISTHDFLLAAMVICLDLSRQISDDPNKNPGGILCPQRNALMDALEKSQKIWSDASGRKRKLAQFVARDELSKGEHMFDETEKASRAMAVMLDKVKARFPASGVNDRLSPQAAFSHLQTPDPSMAFGGIVSLQNWSDLSDLSSMDLSSGNIFTDTSPSAPTMDGSNGASHVESMEPSPDYNLDFAMIGDMLDMQGNMDWETWDNQINKSNTASWASGQPQDNSVKGGEVQIGNALMGGSGPGRQPQQNEGTPSYVNDSTIDRPLDANGKRVYYGAWMSFQDMSNVDFDIDLDQLGNYNKDLQWSGHSNAH